MWIANATRRPEISHAVLEIARHAHDPRIRHCRAALKIVQQRVSLQRLHKRTTVYKENKQDKRSVSGGVAIYAGGTVSWFSRTQHCVILRSTESNYVTVAEVTTEITFLR